jgi:hypothetical protein
MAERRWLYVKRGRVTYFGFVVNSFRTGLWATAPWISAKKNPNVWHQTCMRLPFLLACGCSVAKCTEPTARPIPNSRCRERTVSVQRLSQSLTVISDRSTKGWCRKLAHRLSKTIQVLPDRACSAVVGAWRECSAEHVLPWWWVIRSIRPLPLLFLVTDFE